MKIENIKGLMDVLNGDARNAMHSILGFLELVSEGALNPAQRENIEACRVAVDRHFRGIEDARVILGLTPDEKPIVTPFSPADLFGRVSEAAGLIARRKRIGLFCKVEGSVPVMVAGDVEHIGHALLRIVEAVVNTIEGGDVQLNLRSLSSPLGSNLSFEILAASGTIPAVLMRALEVDDFEFDRSLPGSEALGLAAARSLVIALGGRIQNSPASAGGVRITVILPVSSMPMAGKGVQPSAERSPSSNSGLRILVAEDSEDSFFLFKAYLKDEPHIVSRAVNGAEAVELARVETFDIVFMDIRMPVMDGYEATRRIREWETGKNRARLPIVVLSADDLRSQRRQGALTGCSGHLLKPLSKEDLLEAIRVYSLPHLVPTEPPVLASCN